MFSFINLSEGYLNSVEHHGLDFKQSQHSFPIFTKLNWLSMSNLALKDAKKVNQYIGIIMSVVHHYGIL